MRATRRRHSPILAAASIAALAATNGCAELPDGAERASFDPRGEDGAIAVEWAINGTPADAALCAAAGIDAVEIVVHAEDDLDYEDGRVVAAAPCAVGAWGGRDADGPALSAGRYLVSVEAVDAEGDVVDVHRPDEPVDIVVRGRVALGRADFETVTTLVVWLAWDGDPSTDVTLEDACEEAGVSTYGYTLRDSSGAVVESFSELACEDAILLESIPGDLYSLEVHGVDAAGLVRWSASCEGLAVGDGAYVEHECPIPGASGGSDG